MKINGYGSWGNCSTHRNITISSRLNLLYDPYPTPGNYSYDYYDDGNSLYALDPQTKIRKIYYTSALDKVDHVFSGETYLERARKLKQKLFSDFSLPPKKKLSGWCSWNTFAQYLTKEKLLKQIDWANKVKQELDNSFNYILIDHGYQSVGDDFMHDKNLLQDVLPYIKDKGLIPGLWINPFASTHSDQFRSGEYHFQQKLFLRATRPNSPKLDKLYGVSYLDKDYFRTMTERIIRLYDLGVRLFKFDFNIYFFWQDGDYQKIIEVYRTFYQNLKKLLPQSIFIGCGVPLYESLGLFDFVRVTKDIRVMSLGRLNDYFQNLRTREVKEAQKVRSVFDDLLWNADYDQIDSPEEYLLGRANEKIKLCGFDLGIFFKKETQ